MSVIGWGLRLNASWPFGLNAWYRKLLLPPSAQKTCTPSGVAVAAIVRPRNTGPGPNGFCEASVAGPKSWPPSSDFLTYMSYPTWSGQAGLAGTLSRLHDACERAK